MATEQTSIDWQQLPDFARVRIAQFLPLTGLKTSVTIWRGVRNGTFPPPVVQGHGLTAWRWGDIRSWLAGEWHPDNEEAAA